MNCAYLLRSSVVVRRSANNFNRLHGQFKTNYLSIYSEFKTQFKN